MTSSRKTGSRFRRTRKGRGLPRIMWVAIAVCIIGAVLIFRDQGGDVPTGIGEYQKRESTLAVYCVISGGGMKPDLHPLPLSSREGTHQIVPVPRLESFIICMDPVRYGSGVPSSVPDPIVDATVRSR